MIPKNASERIVSGDAVVDLLRQEDSLVEALSTSARFAAVENVTRQVAFPCRVYGDIHGCAENRSMVMVADGLCIASSVFGMECEACWILLACLRFPPSSSFSLWRPGRRQLLDLLEFFNAFSWPARNQDPRNLNHWESASAEAKASLSPKVLVYMACKTHKLLQG